MLQLKNITKEYITGDTTIQALKGLNLEFRQNEFVSVLGPSGCGKTTLLNIVGGLDRYTSGDLYINNKSTKEFTDGDWDAYRNNSIGFVFQSYNLIPHQTVLSNVELALTLSGVSKTERRQRAKEVLEKVGLADQLHKKPNQMSGGQMQRVAIARALVNNPDILLADEPTGALDTETSVQIMELLKEIAKDRLIIMVTHNPELASTYSTRIIKLLDGNLIDDSNPYHSEKKEKEVKKKEKKAKKLKTSMSFMTALSLSLNNLMTKKTRTFMTAFAGSIGIIGIALIMSLSNGVQNYISKVEEDTLSSYPITIEEQTIDMTSLMSAMMGEAESDVTERDSDKIYSSDIMVDMMNMMATETQTNNLKAFKEHIESETDDIAALSNAIQYGYDMDMHIYKSDTSNGAVQINPNTLFESMGMGTSSSSSSSFGSFGSSMMSMDIWEEMLGNQTLLNSQYEVLAGDWPTAYNEVVLIVDENNEISDFTLYSLGLRDSEELMDMMKDVMAGNEITGEALPGSTSYTYDELLELTFKLVLATDYYEDEDGIWVDKSEDEAYMKALLEGSTDIKVVGIVRPSEEATLSSMSGSIGYTSELTQHIINQVNDAEIVKQQIENPDIDVFTGKKFSDGEEESQEDTAIDMSTLTEEELAYFATLSEEELAALMETYSTTSSATYEENLSILGVVDLDNPSTINIYPIDFASKEKIADLITAYNTEKTEAGQEEYVITYTDLVGMMMSSITTIVNVISYVLIAFVAISLVVSSIMIGIITYISVLERTKEIGILRSIGASKKDISRVFNAETLIVGFVAGMLGIIITMVLTIPINAIIKSISGITVNASLPVAAAVILVIISMVLTLIGGFIPAKIAAKKDPVEALRME